MSSVTCPLGWDKGPVPYGIQEQIWAHAHTSLLCWLAGGKWETQDEMEDVGSAHLISAHLASCHTRFLLVSRTCRAQGLPAFAQAAPSACRFFPPQSHHLMALLGKASCLKASHAHPLVFPYPAPYLFLS